MECRLPLRVLAAPLGSLGISWLWTSTASHAGRSSRVAGAQAVCIGAA
eukprot:CAMPEP_0204596534 /NCGR_PEP_ID=MMETSP0661-20131031/53295_1 /ASSEMBLY_ACC=CAM_ASM_000606 /TAXON_ID=109239 /ORGANISM="Alexandrium margalefi, Strain AMGDE01CS-322" /LENGTH=47 /DNA_ID= /DNA_START= /DNA_END= /DNA_ORIENTATION=